MDRQIEIQIYRSINKWYGIYTYMYVQIEIQNLDEYVDDIHREKDGLEYSRDRIYTDIKKKKEQKSLFLIYLSAPEQ